MTSRGICSEQGQPGLWWKEPQLFGKLVPSTWEAGGRRDVDNLPSMHRLFLRRDLAEQMLSV